MRYVANRLLVAGLLAAGLPAGCGGEDDGAGDGGPRGSPESAADTAAAGSPDAGAPDGASHAAADRRPLRSRLLRLVNPRGEAVVVLASAGREAVVLDTVAAADSAEVTVESRAPRVGLRALAGGRQVGADSLDLTEGGPARWVVRGGG